MQFICIWMHTPTSIDSTAAPSPARALPAPHPASSASLGILRSIRLDGINLAIWDRVLPPSVAALSQNLVARSRAVALDLTSAPGPELERRLAADPVFHNPALLPASQWLLEDVAKLASEFAAVADCSEVRLRLTKIADDGCAVFHVDTVPLRLLCTYAGMGTQWVEEPDLRRFELGLRNRTTAETNAAIVPDANRIRTISTGAVAMIKGRLWPGAQGGGLVHRSHPVCCGDHARLRLAIDVADQGY
jgi:hypothetical protein